MAFFFSLGTVPAAVSKVSRVATSSVLLILAANSDLLALHRDFFSRLLKQLTMANKAGFFTFDSIVYSCYQTTVLEDSNENFFLAQVVYIKCVR